LGDEGKQAKKIGGVSGPPPYPACSTTRPASRVDDAVESW